jgi:hypothetical protein
VSGPSVAKPSGDHIPLGGFVYAPTMANMRDRWMKAIYMVAIALATFGWLLFIGRLVTKVFF